MLLCKWFATKIAMNWINEILYDCEFRDVWWTTFMRMNSNMLLYIVVSRVVNENFVIISNLEVTDAEYEASGLWERIAKRWNAKIYIYTHLLARKGNSDISWYDIIFTPPSFDAYTHTHIYIYIYPSYSQHQLKSYTLLIISSILVLMLRFLL